MKKFKALAALLAAFTLTVGAATATGCGNDNGGKKDDDTHIDVEGVEAPASTNRLLISKTTTTYALTEANPTVNIGVDDVTVSFAQNNTSLGTVAAGDYTLEYYKGTTKVDNLNNISEAGTYFIVAVIENAVVGDATTTTTLKSSSLAITVTNPAQAGTLALSGGTTTQVQSATDEMSSTWTFEVTLANGAKKDVTSEVTIGSLETTTAGENKTVTVTCTVDGVAFSLDVPYTITANQNVHTTSYAVDFSAMEIAAVATDTPLQQGETVVATMKANDGKAKVTATTQEYDGKYFVNRFQFGGGSFTSANALQCDRYFTLETQGAAKITVYYYTNGSAGRGVALYDTATITLGTTVPIGQDTAEDSAVHKAEFNVTGAGTYYLTTANSGDMYFLYIQVDSVVDGVGDDVALPTATEQIGIKLNTADVKKIYLQNDTFDSTGLVVQKRFVNTVSRDVTYETVEDTSSITYSGYDLSALGSTTVTVTVDQYTATYGVYACAIGDVYGVTVSGKNYQIPLEGSEVSADFSADVTASITTVEDANKSLYTVEITKIVDGEGTEVTAPTYTAEGTYTYTVTVSISDGTDSVTVDKELTVNVTKEKEAGASTTYAYTYDGTNDSAWSITANGTATSSDSPTITGPKLVPDYYLELTASGTTAEIALTGFTTGSSNASDFVSIEFLDAEGNVLTTVTGTTPTGKCNGTITFSSEVAKTVTLDSAFAKIRITSNTAGKSIVITSATIVVS